MRAAKSKSTKKSQLVVPLLPVRGLAPLPGIMLPLSIVQGSSAQAIRVAQDNDGLIALTLQLGAPDGVASKDNLCKIGGLAQIENFIELSNGDVKVHFFITDRIKITSFKKFEPFVEAAYEVIDTPAIRKLPAALEKKISDIKDRLLVLGEYDPQIEEHLGAVQDVYEPGMLSDILGAILPLEASDAQKVLEELDPKVRLDLVSDFLDKQLDVLAIKKKITSRVESEIDRVQQREILKEQMRQIRAELGESSESDEDLQELSDKVDTADLPELVLKETKKQVRRLQQLHPDTSEAALARTYVDWILDLPWNKRTIDRIDLKLAQKILDDDHYGLEKTKERILDFLGVRKLRKEHKGPVLLLVGPPGVGKTSLGKSIAKALGREFVHMSVGGLRDEAELRGHRRTYVGALPGRIIQGLKTAGSTNPVFVLDEIDKIGSNFRGDPASVLLEVLDPEQNNVFQDHYLNVPVDLSEVMFIATANMVDTIPPALLDRMEVIELSGYTTEEKREIARRYLMPREQEENGLKDEKIVFTEPALDLIITGYTKESGVRELRRIIATVYRKLARQLAEDKKPPSQITPKLVEKLLGSVRFLPDEKQVSDEVGIVTGLAWTSVGGEILTVEVAITKGKGTLSLTGQLGEVMRESAMAALTWVMSRAPELGIDSGFYESSSVHVHVPQGAIPKDGPSAGVAIATALVSALTGISVSKNVAMTGEITLRGKVIPIGGLREKALAALRMGITTVCIPKGNERELVEFPRYLRNTINFVAVETVDEVMDVALIRSPLVKSGRRGTIRTRTTIRPPE